MGARASLHERTVEEVLLASQRRCCLCYYLTNIKSVRRGQIAHLNRKPQEAQFRDLVWLCLEHHDEYDSRTSQSKGLTIGEVRTYRDRLYKELGVSVSSVYDAPCYPHLQSPPASLREVVANSEGALDHLFGEWVPPIEEDTDLVLLPYNCVGIVGGVCRAERIRLRDGRTMVICEDMEENYGRSVTNAIEEVAFAACWRFGIEPALLVLVEYHSCLFSKGPQWNLVNFRSLPPESMFGGPSWTPLEARDWSLFGWNSGKVNSTSRSLAPILTNLPSSETQ